MSTDPNLQPRSLGFWGRVRRDRTVVMLVGLSLLAAALVLWQQWHAQTQIVDFIAREDAEAYSEALATFRSVYTQHVVNTVKQHDIEVTHDFQDKEKAIPLPATLTKILAQEIGNQGSGIKASLYSKYPFPYPGRPKLGEFPDKFGEQAWNALTADPDKPFSRREQINGQEFLRFATADRMRVQACVDCHNTHPDSPFRDWELNDVRGVLEVSLPMDPIREQQRASFVQLAVLLGAFAALGGVGVVLAVGRTRRTAEVGVLQRSTQELSDVVSGITRQTPQLTSSSEELSDVSQQLSSSAEQTSTQADLVATTAAEISRHVELVAAASQQMESSTREVAQQAAKAAQVATEGVQMAQATNATVTKLGESSRNIGNVVKVITSIAEQTNLLALNATIEAARAGEVGKGFAVVANEVKELAKQTAKATDEIGQRIGAIQEEIAAAVTTIGEVGEIINRINGYQNAVATAVEQQSAATQAIGVNIGQAAKGSADIARNISGVADAARQTSDSAQRTLRSAARVANATIELQALVARSRISK